ncbi:ChaN family lipoprotein [Caldimonas brevitalea]|uniref:Lipoprotein n=1 Tax=Caldimonas brevitalea TaxID=413882 RepID=A0A0G3BXL9_9BURK|nr:ChaN family lipoprotein [Caldimonas brevitalea]AKJ32126.1 lipoprotein [Caldimonas brevitalea]
MNAFSTRRAFRGHAPRRLAGLLLSLLCGCAAAQTAWLFGERHDQLDQQRQVAAEVQRLAQQGRLHALVVEMAERGRHTAGLPKHSSEAQVRDALGWHDKAWPWSQYRDVVMHAVQAGRPVYGGDLPRPALREAMGQTHWDRAVPPPAHARLIEAVREGHCGLLPEAHLPGMVRMQLARDRSLAETLRDASAGAARDRVTVMLSGAVHASRGTGVPLQLDNVAPGLVVRTIVFAAAGAETRTGFDETRPARLTPTKSDPCDALRRKAVPAAPPASGAASS